MSSSACKNSVGRPRELDFPPFCALTFFFVLFCFLFTVVNQILRDDDDDDDDDLW